MQNALLKIMFVLAVCALSNNAYALKQANKKTTITHNLKLKKISKLVNKPSKNQSKLVVTTNTSKKISKSDFNGIASWYGGKFHGHKTASGELFNQNALTAAHKSIPLNSLVEVTNMKNHKSVIVRINDVGPHVKGRIIDLSKRAASKIDLNGIGMVHLHVVKRIDKS